MGLLDTLLSLFGRSDEPPQETTVSVEREPRTETEATVKGVETDEAATEPSPEAQDGTETPTDASDDAETPTETPETGGNGTDDEAAADATEVDADPVQSITGIGPAYADRLSAAGVETVADLVAADLEELAAETDLSEKRLQGWVERARDR